MADIIGAPSDPNDLEAEAEARGGAKERMRAVEFGRRWQRMYESAPLTIGAAEAIRRFLDALESGRHEAVQVSGFRCRAGEGPLA